MRPRNRRGANAVEFAFIFPVLLLFGFGIIDLGWMSLVRSAASSAAAAGARAGALTAQDAGPGAEAMDAASDRWIEVGLPVTAIIGADQSGAPEMMTVTVVVDLTSLTGWVVGPDSIVVSASQRMEDQP
jgi:Flp pilus assembly protein TadG